MKHLSVTVLIIVLTFTLTACEKLTGQTPSPPTITAQGFYIDSIQEGTVGQFGSLRLRVECPAGIQKLQITERSYDVDLASTPDRSHFQFFDLDRRVLLNRDVTLDFQNYINQKLQQDGEYTISIVVTDKEEQSTQAKVLIRLQAPAVESEAVPSDGAPPETSPAQPGSAPLKTGQFEIKRIGPREIEGGKTFGLAWKTIDEIQVTIRVRKQDVGASKLARLSLSDYDNAITQDHLEELLTYADDQEHIDFDTANNAAAGKVLGVVNLGKSYLLKSHHSTTVLSEVGTTVTLSGEFKYQ
jgi:hypothetical protein